MKMKTLLSAETNANVALPTLQPANAQVVKSIQIILATSLILKTVAKNIGAISAPNALLMKLLVVNVMDKAHTPPKQKEKPTIHRDAAHLTQPISQLESSV